MNGSADKSSAVLRDGSAQLQARWLERDENLLDGMERDMASLERDAAGIEAKMSMLCTAWSNIHLRRATLIDRYDALTLTVARERFSLSPASELPVDVLGHIFHLCISDDACDYAAFWDTESLPSSPTSSSITAPFVVATVSRLWRTAALATAPLWSYVVFSSTAGHGAPSIDRFRMGLHRSGQVPLDIFVDTTGMEQSAHLAVLALLYPCLVRWRCARFCLATSDVDGILPYFRGRAPLLEQFSCTLDSHKTGAAQSWPHPSAQYLEASTRLTHYYLSDMPLQLSHVDYPYLEDLRMTVHNIPHNALRDMLGAAHQLRTLDLSICNPEALMTPAMHIELPRLTRLELYDEAPAVFVEHRSTLTLPALRELTIGFAQGASPWQVMADGLQDLFARHAQTLRDLCLYRVLTNDGVAAAVCNPDLVLTSLTLHCVELQGPFVASLARRYPKDFFLHVTDSSATPAVVSELLDWARQAANLQGAALQITLTACEGFSDRDHHELQRLLARE